MSFPAFVAIYAFKCFFWIRNVISRFQKYEKGWQKNSAGKKWYCQRSVRVT